MQKTLHKYSGTKGKLRLNEEDGMYSVYVETFKGASTSVQSTPYLTYDAAWDHYLKQWRVLTGLTSDAKQPKPLKMCYFGGATCKCSPRKCPAELGGAAYWEIFRNSCQYRTR